MKRRNTGGGSTAGGSDQSATSSRLAELESEMREEGWEEDPQESLASIRGTSRVGNVISQAIKVKVILGAIGVVLLVPLLSNSSNAASARLSAALNMLEVAAATERDGGYPAGPGGLVDEIATSLDNSLDSPLLWLRVAGATNWSVSPTDDSVVMFDSVREAELRDREVETIITPTGSEVRVDVSHESQRESLLGFLQIQLIILLLGLQAFYLQRDVERLLVWPIERIYAFLRPVMDDAITSLAETQSGGGGNGIVGGMDSTWRRMLGRRDDGEEMSTKFILAAIDAMRRDLSQEARRNFAMKTFAATLQREAAAKQIKRSMITLRQQGVMDEGGVLHFLPTDSVENRGGTFRPPTSIIPYAALGGVAEDPSAEQAEEEQQPPAPIAEGDGDGSASTTSVSSKQSGVRANWELVVGDRIGSPHMAGGGDDHDGDAPSPARSMVASTTAAEELGPLALPDWAQQVPSLRASTGSRRRSSLARPLSGHSSSSSRSFRSDTAPAVGTPVAQEADAAISAELFAGADPELLAMV